MIVTCDNCNTGFNVPESAIGEHGRFVRCSKCGYEWVATLPEKPFNLEEEVVQEISSPPLTAENNVELAQELKPDLTARNGFEKEAEFNLDSLRPKKIMSPEVTPSLRKKTFFYYILLILTAVAVVILACISLLVYKESIIKKLPYMEKMYKKAGIYNYGNLFFESLNCQVLPQTSTTASLKTQAVSIGLRIKNTGLTTQRLSYIRITAFNKKMNKLTEFKIKQMRTIKPKKEQVVNISINTMPKETKFISVEMGNYPEFYLYNSKTIKTVTPLK